MVWKIIERSAVVLGLLFTAATLYFTAGTYYGWNQPSVPAQQGGTAMTPPWWIWLFGGIAVALLLTAWAMMAIRLRYAASVATAPPQSQRPARSLYPLAIQTIIAAFTCAFVGWQTWIWFHPATSSNVTQAQLDAYADKKVALTTKPLRDQVEQLTKENETLQHGGTDAAKLIAGLRAQITQLQSDKPISVDRVPTSMRVVFNSNATYTQIDAKNIAAWEPITLWSVHLGLLSQGVPVLAFILIFKKPVIFDDVQVDAHDTVGLTGKVDKIDPHFAIVEFSASLPGLVDITVQNKQGK